MRHLSDENLARLVDERPTTAEEEHLRSCDTCSTILRELREQTEALASLPALRPPAGDWEELEARLARKGLIGVDDTEEVGPREDLPSHPRAPFEAPWLQVAAALVLFLGGTAFGTWMIPDGEGPADGSSVEASSGSRVDEIGNLAGDRTGRLAGDVTGGASGIDEAALELRSAEERYVEALVTYRELLREADGRDSDAPENPAARYAALEALLAASQEAIRHAPADPFFNGVLASTMAERQEAIRQISTSDDDSWF